MRVFTVVFLVACSWTSPLPADESRDRLIVDTVLKLDSFNYEAATSKVKDAIGRYLSRNSGSEEYYQLVERFRITDQLPVLVKLSSDKEVNARAAGLLVAFGGESAMAAALADSGNDRESLLMSLGAVNDGKSVAALTSVLEGKDLALARQAATALTGSPAGQVRLLELAEAGNMPDEFKQGVSLALSASVDPAIRSRVAKVLPTPASIGGESLPALADLVKMRGDSGKGQLVYMRACFTCHKVGGKGIDFGPALSEIGDKLAREALYTAIIDPSEAISFGYEGVAIETANAQKLIGYVVSDGDEELAIKVPGGALVSIKRRNIKSKEALSVSLMPSALVSTMSRDDLVNLVEYLTTLKK